MGDYEFKLENNPEDSIKNSPPKNKIALGYNFITSIPQKNIEDKDDTLAFLINDTDTSGTQTIIGSGKLNKDMYKLYKKIGVDKIADLFFQPYSLYPKALFNKENKEVYTTVKHMIKPKKTKSFSNLMLPPIIKKKGHKAKAPSESNKYSHTKGISLILDYYEINISQFSELFIMIFIIIENSLMLELQSGSA